MIKTIFAAGITMVLADGQELKTQISLQNPTRIIFEDDRPTKLIFNEANESAPSIAAVLGNSGDIFVTVERGLVGQKISGFMTTESGKTYPVRFDIGSLETSQITVASSELRQESAKAEAASLVSEITPQEEIEWNKKNSYTASLGNLLRRLYWHQLPEGFKEQRASKLPIITTDGFIATPKKNFVAGNALASVYTITPTKEYAIYLPNFLDELPTYRAMSYSHETIEPGSTGYLYLVRDTRGGQ